MKIGYARVSTQDQNSALQVDALTAAGCARIFTDEASGASFERAGLAAALEATAEGDTLIVWKLDRLGRSVGQVVGLLDGLRARGVAFQSITEAIDTATPYGRAVWQIVAVMAELERGLMLERTRAGLASAKARGKRIGRPPAMTAVQVRQAGRLIESGEHPDDVAASFTVSRSTLYRYLAASRQGEALEPVPL